MPRLKEFNTIYIIILISWYNHLPFGTHFENILLAFLGFACIIGAVIYRLLVYRCLHCGKYLDRSTGQYCPFCIEDVNKL